MNILAVDTQSKIMAVVIVSEDTERGVVLNAGVTHSETLMPTIDEVLRTNDLTLDDIDYFAVDVGPGSFTGIRIGVNTINALAYATSKQVIQFNAFEANVDRIDGINAIDCKHSNYYVEIDGELSVASKEVLSNKKVNYLDATSISISSIASAVRRNLENLVTQAVPEYVRESEAERNLCV